MSTAIKIPSVNYHLWQPCNMKCGFCFATFQDIDPDNLPKGHIGRDDCISVVEALGEAGFQKINFAGGEPTLCPWLSELITRASEIGLVTSIVTNGSRITSDWLQSVEGHLDWTALSIDSVNRATSLRIGRATQSGPLGEDDYLKAVDILRTNDVRVKVNTVVTRFNLEEDMTDFIIEARPERWKLFQVLPVKGQNDFSIGEYVVSGSEFERYVKPARRAETFGIEVVPESNELMRGSYVMVDPAGRFFDNVEGGHTYCRPILEVGVEEALRDVSQDPGKFIKRNGLYNW